MPAMSTGTAVDFGTSESPRRVFISYSRADGSQLAHRLRDLVQTAKHEVWLDTDRLAGGASWSKEIEAALNNCDVLIAVLTDGSYRSEICRAEQMWALRQGKQVIPVLSSPDVSQPLYLSTLNYRRFPEAERELLTDLQTRTPVVHALSTSLGPRYDTVPPLPQNFIPREETVAALRDLIFAEGNDTSIAVTALSGMGGIGKTVLASAVCRDQAIQRAFPDGIAWITTGREWDGDFVPRMREVARALGDDLSGYDNPLACQNRYRQMLRERAALVVVDDVWNLEHLKLLLVDAPRSRFLFTTRDTGIARAVTDRRYPANLLGDAEARLLLAGSAAMKPSNLPPQADAIIQACGGLAAAISQVGASLRDLSPAEWQDTLAALETADIGAIEEQLPSGQQSFFKSLAVSIQAMPSQMQERYLKLAVLLEDVAAPLVVMETLWAVNTAETRRTARYLVDRSLGTWASSADPSVGIQLHDLQMDYIRALYPGRESLALIHGAVRLSAHVTASDPRQFASQMTGRLLPHRSKPYLQLFLDQIAAGALKPWLRPLHPALHPPGTALVRTLEGHSSGVNDVALSADGKRAVSSAWDNTLTVWDLASGRPLSTVDARTNPFKSMALTANGKLAVFTSKESTLNVWDVESAREIQTLQGRFEWVNAAASDGAVVVCAFGDGAVKVWNLASGQLLQTLEGHSDSASSVALTPDGKRVLSASADRTLKIWDLETGEMLRTLEGHSDSVAKVAVTTDGKRAVSASGDRTLKVWDLETGVTLGTLEGHAESISGLALTADGKRAVSGSSDNTVKVWDLETLQLLTTLKGHSDAVASVVVTADGRQAVSASWDKTLKVWDLESRSVRYTEGHANWVNRLTILDQKYAISASRDKTLKLWDLESGRTLRTLEGHSAGVNCVAASADGKRIVSGANDHTLKVWEVASGLTLQTLQGHSDWVKAVALTADGRLAVSASYDNTLKVWDLESECLIRTFTGHSHWVNAVALTVDGKHAISASYDAILIVWDMVSGAPLQTLTGHTVSVTSLAVLEDGNRLVSVSSDKTLKLWDLKSGSVIHTLEGHALGINDVAVTADGERACSASDDKTVKVWDLKNGICIATFRCDAGVHCCAFAGTNQILAGDTAGHVHFLRLEETL